MKKVVLALAALGALGTGASAADLPASTHTKAPPPPVAPNWTGFYVFGGGGGGFWAADQSVRATGSNIPPTFNQRQGGSGQFGTVGAGYDWQFNSSWLVGILADGQFGGLKGSLQDPVAGFTATEKLQDSWAVGVRLGHLIAPNVMSYANAGYSAAHWGNTELFGAVGGLPVGVHTNGFTSSGLFVGGGVENNLDIFGIRITGLFMKTEYRSAFYGWKTVDELFDGTNLPVGRSFRFNNWDQTISTSLVYRFDWTGR
jgi:outer membrane immunogenic protein